MEPVDARWPTTTAAARAPSRCGPAGPTRFQLRLAHVPRDLRAQFVNATGSATRGQRILTALRTSAHDAYVALAGEPARAQDVTGAPPMVTREQWGAAACGPPRFSADVRHGADRVRPPHGQRERLRPARTRRPSCARSAATTARRSAGGTSATTSSSIASGRSSRGARAGSTRPSSARRRRATTASRPASRTSARSARCRRRADAVNAMAELLAWKLTLHGAPVEGQVTVLSRGGPTNRYPAGTPVTFERISGHRNADATTCPGDALFAQLPELRGLAAEIAPELPRRAPAPGATVTLDRRRPDARLPAARAALRARRGRRGRAARRRPPSRSRSRRASAS